MNLRIANEALSSIHSDLLWSHEYLDDLEEEYYEEFPRKELITMVRSQLKDISRSCHRITKALEAKPDPPQEPPPR